MPKFMINASYTAEGMKGLQKDGGSGRRASIQKAIEALGGKLESFYFAFGKTDAVVICDVPDTASGVALGLAVNATGMVRATTTPLISVEEIDAACKKTVNYRAPGA